MTNDDGYGRWARTKDGLRFFMWAVIDIGMILWGGHATDWGKDFWKIFSGD